MLNFKKLLNYKVLLKNFGKYSLPIAFLRDIYDWHLPIEKANNLESISKKGTNYLKKISFK